ncbi:tRNA(fMet)-specific endonuclease VapC [Sulfuracidifex tepidarius]|uniref:tRNA(fMet)-specific endonuclease VapC n=2 Tax=Sulfuracidifex tepidarius TaxID=1294262 RepID=A0A510DT11_9CREN|nr:tRNA(fMet)-specific endonuclease VapC [Sulfuracidifex tepidarius]BBG26056.1 tRNA(fMet)-specific endonuclease VapC [Sulfuracidifex tepidarius]
MVFDSGVTIDMLSGSDEGKKVENYIEDNLDEVIINELNVEEIKYVVCKKSNEKRAEEVENMLKTSGYFTIFPFSSIRGEVYKIKCKYPISLADASSVATAKISGLPVLFRREKEIEPFKVELNVTFVNEIH